MKIVVSIHLGGKMFQIEEDAYTVLNSSLSNERKKQEMEERIAERFEQKLNSGKSVITYPDVADVLYQLGVPVTENQSYTGSWREKRLYRQPKNKMIAGICSGLGEYFEVDPVVVRILFVIALFMISMGFWLYIILWIIVPKKINNTTEW